MNTRFRKTLMATAIAALMTSPAWAQTDTRDLPDAVPESAPGQSMEGAPPVSPAPEDRGGYLAPDAAGSNNPLYTMTPNQLRRGDVIDADGEKVGTIKTVVLNPDHESIHAVVSSGGILGFGAREITISFDEMRLSDDKVQVRTTKEELMERAGYVPEEYVELEPDRPISEFSAFEPMPDEEPGAGPVPEPPL